jgi:hypothetical protein
LARWPIRIDPHTRHAIETAERYADGEGTIKALMQAGKDASRVARTNRKITNRKMAAHLAELAAGAADWDPGMAVNLNFNSSPTLRKTLAPIIVRDIIGNPFRPVVISPAWLTATVLSLAQAAYDDRTLPAGTLDNTLVAILADALEEAGCQDQDLLVHCRSGGEHVRGCWVVDLILGKT